MPTDFYSDGTLSDARYDRRADVEVAQASSGYRDPAGTAFIWIAWALAFAFWAFSMGTFFGILGALRRGGPGTIMGGVDAGGAGFMLMDVIGGVIVLGAALAWGMARWATRDKRRDPITEAATAELYDSVERAGGDDMVERSPEARRPQDRDSYRPA
jgi:hypothetical protein